MRTKIGENDKCVFYRDDNCKEIDADEKLHAKYGDYFTVLAIQKDPAKAHRTDEYLLVDRKTNDGVAVVTYTDFEWVMKREMEYLCRGIL